jgi:WD40 repeat protein
VADVFISYSRRGDTDLVDHLAAALAQRGQEAWVDRADIFPSSPWRPEIEQAVLEAHAMVFVVSPDSVASEYCLGELAMASGVGKRIVPVLARETPMESVPDDLASLHFLSFVGGLEADGSYGQTFDAQVDRLVEVLSTDIESLHLQTRLLTQSRLWAQRQHDKGLLLRGRELEEAERWLDDQVSEGRILLPDQQRLVRESRRAAIRRQRGSASTALVVAVVMLVLGVVALVQRSQAVHQSNVALADQLAAESASASASDVTVQDLLALEAYRWSPTEQARASVVAAAEQPLQDVLPGTLGEVNQVAYDPAGKLLAVASVRGVSLWRTATDKVLGGTLDAGQVANGVAFNPQGTLLAVAQDNGSVALFAMPGEKEKAVFPTDGSAVTAVAFSSRVNEMAAVTEKGSLYLWDFASGVRTNFSVGSGGSLLSVAFDPRAPLIAVGGGFNVSRGENGFVTAYSQALAPQWTYPVTGTDFSNVAFNADGSTVGAADGDAQVVLLSSSAGKKLGALRLASSAQEVAFAPSGPLMATSDSQGAVQLWNSSSLAEVGVTMEDGSDVFGLAFSPDGRSLASGDLGGDIVLWSASTFMPQVASMAGPSVLQLSVNSNSRVIATADRDGSVDIWDLSTRSVIAHLGAGANTLTSVVFSPLQANRLAIGDSSGHVSVYALPNEDPVVLNGPDSSVNNAVFSPDGDRLAVGYGNGDVDVWDLRSHKQVGHFKAPSASAGGVIAMAFNPEENEVAATYEDWGIEVFPVGTAGPPRAAAAVDAIFSLAFSPDGSELMGGDGLGNVELFSASSLRPTETLPGDGSTIFALSVAPDGRTLATADYAGDLQLWDLATAQKLGPALNVGSPLLGLGFSPDARLLVTGDNAGTIVLWPSLLWSTDLKAFSADLCPRLRRNLSPAQWRQYVPDRPYHTICPGYPEG